MNLEGMPVSVEIPSWYFDSALFGDSDAGERREGLILLQVVRPEEQLTFELRCCGPHLGPDHLALWKVLRVQQCLRRGDGDFDISVSQIMRLLEYEEYSEEQRDSVLNRLNDLMDTDLDGDGKWVTKGGRRRNFGLASRLVMKSEREDTFSIKAGPGDCGFPDKLSTVSVAVTSTDVEVASQPPPARPDPQFSTDPLPSQQRKRQQGPGYVYILTNTSMPGLIKIGKTRLNPEDRANQLQTTGVPRGFQVEYACRTTDPEAVEQAMHVAFGPRRVSDRREFFEIEPDQAIAVLSLHHQTETSTTIQ
ncbi:GIY-YIG nuclease family protein [Pseudoxanthomonas winnipegensis]|uniref:GIY-YIG nuclease family protein n=1 Tax=Pseudoxanthomonas winnipegensis TaxID=2480810 RepID=UPI00103C8D06|nr:GIY-YIG nuclease family protein [Pseudoxanthomonas winnipegensis]TBV74803.1 GIY-YIG nuclease family protein [Pseudoxanthomonas winnipegensis]